MRGGTDYALYNSVVVGAAAGTNCLDIDATGGSTIRAADAGLQDLGPPAFRSVRLSCPNAYRNDGNVTVAEVAAIFGDGTNNNEDAHVSTLTNVFVNGANEAAVVATDPTVLNADAHAGAGQPNAAAPNRMSAVTYIGAVRDAADTWYAGWTCNSSYVGFGAASGLCTAIPIG
jgi:hypothetical protein